MYNNMYTQHPNQTLIEHGQTNSQILILTLCLLQAYNTNYQSQHHSKPNEANMCRTTCIQRQSSTQLIYKYSFFLNPFATGVLTTVVFPYISKAIENLRNQLSPPFFARGKTTHISSTCIAAHTCGVLFFLCVQHTPQMKQKS